METKRLALLAVLVVVALVFGMSFTYNSRVRSGWPTQALGFTPSEDGFYHLDWNSKGELQLVYLGSYGPHYALLYGRSAGGDWNITYLSRLFYDHDGASLALDSKDNVYVCTHSYDYVEYTGLGPHILFATNAGGHWETEIINVTGYCSAAEVAVGAQDDLHLLYSRDTHQAVDNPNSSIVDMTRTSDGWTSRVLKSSFIPYVFYRVNDIDRRPDGTIGMIYTTFELQEWDEVIWSRMNYSIISDGELISDITILPSLGGYPGVKSVCHDSGGNAYVSSYRKTNELYDVCFLTNAYGNWTCVDVAYGGNSSSFNRYGTGTDITVTSDGSIYIGYFVEDYDGKKANHTVRYCTNSGGAWRSHVIDECRGWLMKESIAIITDQNQDVHVVYYNGQSYNSVYTTSRLDPDRFKTAAYDATSTAALFGLVATAIALLLLRHERKKTRDQKWSESTGLYESR